MIKTRQEAFDAGDKVYNNGKPCKKGHATGRYVSTGNCLGCNSAYSRHPGAIMDSRGRAYVKQITIKVMSLLDEQTIIDFVEAVNEARLVTINMQVEEFRISQLYPGHPDRKGR